MLLKALVKKLKDQRAKYCLYREVEILVAVDNGCLSIGCKRNQLVQQAKGKYICFVDDDDDVAEDYLPLLVEGCYSDPEVDCVGIVGDILWKGEHRPFKHSIQYDEWKYENGVFTRPPNHLNPVKREIAVQFPFSSKDRGEDFDYSTAMCKAKVLQRESYVPCTIYFYTPNGA